MVNLLTDPVFLALDNGAAAMKWVMRTFNERK
jgi:hypothetical protein